MPKFSLDDYLAHTCAKVVCLAVAIDLSIDHKISGVRGIYNIAKYKAERRQLAKWYRRELDK